MTRMVLFYDTDGLVFFENGLVFYDGNHHNL